MAGQDSRKMKNGSDFPASLLCVSRLGEQRNRVNVIAT